MIMADHHASIRQMLARVRARWRRLRVFEAVVRGALALAAVFTAALFLGLWTARSPLALAATGAAALVAGAAALAWGLRPLRDAPSDARLARFIEERVPSLDDRLVSAVDVVSSPDPDALAPLARTMLADAAARADAVDLDAVVPGEALRRAGFQAVAAALVLAAVAFVGRDRAREAWDAAVLALFPSRVTLQVTPGNARVKAGDALAIEAELVGNRAPVEPQVQIASDQGWRDAPMRHGAAGRFRLALPSVSAPFQYRVVAGKVVSPTFAIAVVRPPRVARIDVDYTYPASLGLKPRTDEDSGDIYAPAGTAVRLRIQTDRPAAAGKMTLADGAPIALTPESPTLLSGTLTVSSDNSYRVELADSDGLSNPGDTEYFIRTLADRPPEVHVVKPASDRSVTQLEEVEIEAQADDDYGIQRMDLMYSVRGGPEQRLAFDVPQATSVTGRRTLYLEDLGVKPGDFVSYYVRAKDLARGKRASEARSDIFFLEVKPFEQEFSLAESQSMAGSGYNGSIDDLVNAQKQVVVATWKLDRRSRSTNGAQSEADVRTVSKTETDLKTRVEETSSSFRESTMRDPRRPGRGDPAAPKPGQTMPEEDQMTAAAGAMGKAVTSLDAIKTADALPPELEALNHLLKAQADVKKRQVARQQAGAGGAGSSNRNYDVSTLFDKELQRTQQTNYETPPSAETKKDAKADTLDQIRELAKRQDELLKGQEDLARARERMSAEELKRQLEKLTREQSELRQQAEQMAERMSSQSSPSSPSQSSSQPSGQQAGRQDPSAKSGATGQAGDRMRDVSEQMRNAAGELRRQDPGQASAKGQQALEGLRELERRLESARPDERRRALGEMQLESRQLADAERQMASELSKLGQGDAAKDALRRLAGEQQRLAGRAQKLQQGLKEQAAAAAGSGDPQGERQASAQASRDLERQKIAERMRQSADELRAAAGEAGGGKSAKDRPADPRSGAGATQEMARALDKAADTLASAGGDRDALSRKLSDQMARARDLRNRLTDATRDLRKLGEQAGRGGETPSAQKAPGQTGRADRGQSGGGGTGGGDLARLREQYAKELRDTQELLNQMRREDPSFARSGEGFTFEGQGMTLSAPGTEAFKQDFAKWDDLRRQATRALESVESSLSKRLREKEAKDRLAAGVDDKAPARYQQQVDSYFKALASKKKRD